VLTPVEAKKVKALTKDPVVRAQIEADLTRGSAIPVMSTPTLLVSTRAKKYPISGLNNYSLLKSFLDGLLK
jgi:predicted DsbA family dithiol-disulfide isomerase